jgi:Flp pilus assembly protein TadB
VRLPRNISPAAARRRAWLFDLILGLLIALAMIVVAAGIGVVGFFGLLCAVALVPWYLIDHRRRDRGPRHLRRRRSG